jgi:hypothetical protein
MERLDRRLVEAEAAHATLDELAGKSERAHWRSAIALSCD